MAETPNAYSSNGNLDNSFQERSEFDLLISQLALKPVDPQGWNKLVSIAESTGETDKIKIAYDGLLETYPNTASAQIAYISHYLNINAFDAAEELFKRYLKAAPFVELWKFYITYIRRINADASKRDTIRQSYEFALGKVGQDKSSGELWMDYIQFIKAGVTTTTWDEQQKMDALRKVYHRAVQVPIENIESVWSELEAFEIGLNRITAKKFMADLSPSYMQARTVLRQLQKHLAPLFLVQHNPTGHYLPAEPVFDSRERGLVGNWKTYLKWEESNPLEIDMEKEKQVFVLRLQGVYRKAVVRMRFYSEIWYMAYVWTNSVGKKDEALNILRAGIVANPSSFLLNFALAEAYEANQKLTETYATFDKLLQVLRAGLETLQSDLEAVGNTSTDTQLENPDNSQSSSNFDGERNPREKDLVERRKEYGLAWIMYIRAARRAESQTKAREIFKAARQDTKWTPWDVFESAALMEYHVARDTALACRIFELGMKPEKFAGDAQYVLRYLSFLISVNDEQNARALFERVIQDGKFTAEVARPLWERWARYEYQYSSLEASMKLEARMTEVYPTDPHIKRFAQRHIYLGTDGIASRDLGFAIARQSSSVGSTSSTSATAVGKIDPAPATPLSYKRPSSPERKREDGRGPSDHGHGSGPVQKRARGLSPMGRERFDSGPVRKRFDSPVSWDRERPPPPRRNEDEKPVTLPPVVSWFIGQLPVPQSYDAPRIRVEDMMGILRNVVMPNNIVRERTPPLSQRIPPPGAGRPPPDYGPYQGPGPRPGRRY